MMDLRVFDLYPNGNITMKLKPVERLRRQVANGITQIAVSPDGRLIATTAENDRLVKVWHTIDDQKGMSRDVVSLRSSDLELYFVYAAHPRAVTSLSWRHQPSRHGLAPNVLLTGCADNVHRIWVESAISHALNFRLLHCIASDPITFIDWLQLPRDEYEQSFS